MPVCAGAGSIRAVVVRAAFASAVLSPLAFASLPLAASGVGLVAGAALRRAARSAAATVFVSIVRFDVAGAGTRAAGAVSESVFFFAFAVVTERVSLVSMGEAFVAGFTFVVLVVLVVLVVSAVFVVALAAFAFAAFAAMVVGFVAPAFPAVLPSTLAAGAASRAEVLRAPDAVAFAAALAFFIGAVAAFGLACAAPAFKWFGAAATGLRVAAVDLAAAETFTALDLATGALAELEPDAFGLRAAAALALTAGPLARADAGTAAGLAFLAWVLDGMGRCTP